MTTRLPGAGRPAVTYELIVTHTTGDSETTTCDTFAELSAAIDVAMSTPGFVRYEVRGTR